MTRIGFIAVYHWPLPADAAESFGAAEIRHRHRSQGWRDIGFHYVIRRDGTTDKGRPDVQPGAHDPRINSHSIAICLTGTDPFDPSQLAELRQLVTRLTAEHPAAAVIGRRDIPGVRTDEPGFDVAAWWASQGDPE